MEADRQQHQEAGRALARIIMAGILGGGALLVVMLALLVAMLHNIRVEHQEVAEHRARNELLHDAMCRLAAQAAAEPGAAPVATCPPPLDLSVGGRAHP